MYNKDAFQSMFDLIRLRLPLIIKILNILAVQGKCCNILAELSINFCVCVYVCT